MECIWMVALTIVFQHKIITARIAFAKRSLAFYFHRNNNNNYSEWSFQHYCRRYLSLSASAYCIPNTYSTETAIVHRYSYHNTHTLSRVRIKIKNKNFCWLRISVCGRCTVENSYCRRIRLIQFCFLTVRVVFLVSVLLLRCASSSLFFRASARQFHCRFCIKYLLLLFSSHLMSP